MLQILTQLSEATLSLFFYNVLNVKSCNQVFGFSCMFAVSHLAY